MFRKEFCNYRRMVRAQIPGKVTFERGRSLGGGDHRERETGSKVEVFLGAIAIRVSKRLS